MCPHRSMNPFMSSREISLCIFSDRSQHSRPSPSRLISLRMMCASHCRSCSSSSCLRSAVLSGEAEAVYRERIRTDREAVHRYLEHRHQHRHRYADEVHPRAEGEADPAVAHIPAAVVSPFTVLPF